jgi:hypothetical protein
MEHFDTRFNHFGGRKLSLQQCSLLKLKSTDSLSPPPKKELQKKKNEV